MRIYHGFETHILASHDLSDDITDTCRMEGNGVKDEGAQCPRLKFS